MHTFVLSSEKFPTPQDCLKLVHRDGRLTEAVGNCDERHPFVCDGKISA
mgnify:CR=1 FL=1